MITDKRKPPINVVQLLPVLEKKLMSLLTSLNPEDWQKPTIAKSWTIKDIVAHLLDGNVRVLSMLRDNYFGESLGKKTSINLIDYLNCLNADWVKAMKRVSPAILINLHQATGYRYNEYYASLDPFGKSPFAVDWAGEKESLNWMHIAREYTEKWLHQQQVRDVLNDKEIMTRELYYPFIDIFMLALPHTYRNVEATDGTLVRITIPSGIGGHWNIIAEGGKWILDNANQAKPVSEVIIDAGIAWKLFSKSIRPQEIKHSVQIEGDQQLGEIALTMISVMA
ncbi:MAG: maleylpyruvate isomerase N-terminal domain-containing protein [Ferruginibacter sp.]